MKDSEKSSWAQRIRECANTDISQPPVWALEKLLKQAERAAIHADSRNPALLKEVCDAALDGIHVETARALVMLWSINGYRRLDDPASVATTRKLFRLTFAVIVDLPESARKNWLLGLYQYNLGVAYTRWGEYRASIIAHSQNGAMDPGPRGAISRYLVLANIAWQAFVDGDPTDISEAVKDLKNGLSVLQGELRGTEFENTWGNAPGILHLLQALLLSGAPRDAEWEALFATFSSGRSGFGPQCEAWMQVFESGIDLDALKSVAEGTNQHDAMAGANLIIARIHAPRGENDLAAAAFVKVTKGPNADMFAAVADREIPVLGD